MTMKEIGGILGINESRVSQIHKSALEKMQVVLQANGIDEFHFITLNRPDLVYAIARILGVKPVGQGVGAE